MRSVCASWLEGSALFQWWVTDAESDCRPLSGSRIGHAGPWLGRILVGMLILFGLLHFSLAGMGWTLTVLLAFRFPLQAVWFLPTALLLNIRFFALSLGSQSEFLRLDQALVFAVTARLLATRQLRDSSLYVPMIACLIIAAISVSHEARHLGMLLQQIELFLVFVCVYSMGTSHGMLPFYAWGVPIVAAAAYGIMECVIPLETLSEGIYRAFERGHFIRQANHFAGVFAMAAPVGLALSGTSRGKVFGISLFVCACIGIMATHSREGACALAGGCVALICLRHPRMAVWILGGALLGLILALDLYWESITMPSGSLHARFLMWQAALSTVPEHPLFGLGTGVRPRSQYDNFYLMILSENGLAGLLAWISFILMLLRKLARISCRNLLQHPSPALHALEAGAFGAFVAVIIQGCAAIVFSITLTAGMLFWITGYALAAPTAVHDLCEPSSP